MVTELQEFLRVPDVMHANWKMRKTEMVFFFFFFFFSLVEKK